MANRWSRRLEQSFLLDGLRRSMRSFLFAAARLSRWVLFGAAADDAAADVSPRVEADRRRLDEAGSPAGTLPMGQGGRVPAATLAAWVEALGLL